MRSRDPIQSAPVRGSGILARAARLAVIVSVPLAAACGGGSVIVPPPESPSPGPPSAVATVAIQPRLTTQGARVAIDAMGFSPSSNVNIGFGPPEAEYVVIATARSDRQGRVRTTINLPDWAQRGRPYVIVVSDRDNFPRVVSDELIIRPNAVVLRVMGRLTSEGVECRAMRSQNGTLYTLTGANLSDFRPGDRVTVTGTVAEASTCMQGITLDVRQIARR